MTDYSVCRNLLVTLPSKFPEFFKTSASQLFFLAQNVNRLWSFPTLRFLLSLYPIVFFKVVTWAISLKGKWEVPLYFPACLKKHPIGHCYDICHTVMHLTHPVPLHLSQYLLLLSMFPMAQSHWHPVYFSNFQGTLSLCLCTDRFEPGNWWWEATSSHLEPTSSACQAISKELDRKRSSQDLSQCPYQLLGSQAVALHV